MSESPSKMPQRERRSSSVTSTDHFSEPRERTFSGHQRERLHSHHEWSPTKRDRAYSSTERSDHTHMTSVGTMGNEILIIQGFTEKAQELTIIARKRTSSIHIDPKELHDFAFELQDFHLRPAEEVSTIIGTSIATGLSTEEAVSRLEKL
eukprot:gene28955-32700_t